MVGQIVGGDARQPAGGRVQDEQRIEPRIERLAGQQEPVPESIAPEDRGNSFTGMDRSTGISRSGLPSAGTRKIRK